MLKEERHKVILDILHREGRLVANSLIELLSVSEDTVRRDLRELAEAGKLQKVHGGAILRSTQAATHEGRSSQASGGKVAVAQAAVKLLRPGMVVVMDGGTTMQQVVRSLPPDLALTVVTHSPTTAVALAEHPLIMVVVIGGTLYKADIVSVGTATVKAFGEINADLCLLGIWSLHPDIGHSHPNYEEVQVKRAMAACANQVVALASAEKLGTVSAFVIGPATDFTTLVTDPTASAEMRKAFTDQGVTVITE